MERKPLYTLEEARRLAGVDILGRDVAYKLARKHGFRLGRRWVLPARVVAALLEGRLNELENPAGPGGER
jgi:hypothetical protein